MIHKTTRSILSVLLAVLLLVTSIPLTPAFADGGAVSLQSVSGEGRALKPVNGEYQIYTADDLKEFAAIVNGTAEGIAQNTSANAKLMNDIDLSSVCGENIDGGPVSWTPIGNSSNNQYTGTFNGNGKTISGLYINNSSFSRGLFGYVGSGGIVQNLSVSGTVSGGMFVGGIAGRNGGNVINCAFSGSVSGNSPVGGVVGQNSGTVKNSYNTGSVTGSNSPVGGVVGYNDSGGSVTNCYNTGTVSSTSNSGDPGGVGGVVGDNGGTVENCYNTGSVTGTSNYVGGVVGWNISSVTNCYNTGSVTGSNSPVGGVVGYNISSVTNCYNTGSVSGPDSVSGSYVGGVVGLNSSSTVTGTVTGCYFLQQNDVPAQGIGSDGSAAGAAAVKDLDELCKKFENLTDTWSISDTLNRPVLTSNHEDDGTQAHPYRISTATQLENFRDIVNGTNGQRQNKSAHAKLMNNINLSSVCGENAGESGQSVSWTPIGNSIGNPYEGTFNGDGHTISGLYIKNTSNITDYQGLFGFVGSEGTVQNLTVDGTVSGSWSVGGVVGYNNGGTVTGCTFSVSGTVSGRMYVGGVVGRNSGTYGSVTNCYNTGEVTGSTSGGVVGYNQSGTVENCYNTGTVSGSDYVGGVVGSNSGSVKNCYFLKTADVNKNLSGIGFGGEGQEAIQKTADAFHSGEVAYLLEQNISDDKKPVWGQSKLNTPDSLPTLVALDKANAQKVYQVTFNYGTSFADNDERFAYSYTNGVVSKPDKNPELDGHTLSGWYSDESLTTEWNFDTEISNDTTLYAKWTPVAEPEPDPEPTPDPEPEEPPYSGKYSYEVFTSVGDNGTISVDRYATEGDEVTIIVTPDEAYKLDDLSVTANGKDVELTAGGDGTYSFTMPSADVRITATFAEDPDWTEPEEPATDVSDLFIDIAPDAWYKDAVQYAYDNGLMTGTSATTFEPEATTTRAMIVSILARLEGVESAQAAGFADVDDEWYATAVNWAANVGVVNGYEDNTFRPNTAITREQLAAILMNYAAYKGEDVSNRASLATYTDQPSTWAEEAMSWAVAEGLISGVTADTLQPQGAATRAQVAAILQRFLSE